MLFVVILFWALLFFGRDELGIKGIGAAVLVWSGLLVGFIAIGVPALFTTAQAVVDIVLVLIVFHGDVKIR